jgi:DNA invertase Pin-like site-specific DNA recombinase
MDNHRSTWRKPITSSPEQGDTFELADLSLYFHPIGNVQRGDDVILCMRVSGRAQKGSGNLDDQERHLRRVVAERGANVVGVVRKTGSGSDTSWLHSTIMMAKESGAKLLAESVSRFIRSEQYHSVKAPDARPSKAQMDSLLAMADGVVLVTVLNPSATPAEERGFQTTRGQVAKNGRGGRPAKNSPGYKIRRRLRLQPLVQKLRKEGASWSEIARRTGLPQTTIRGWAT